MEGGGAGKGLDGQMILSGKETSENGAAKSIPPCCLKARASAPELEAKCHSTVVSGWFSRTLMVPTSSFIITIPCGLSSRYDKVLVLDGIVQLTEKDECAYQDMIVHLPLYSIPSPRNVFGQDDRGRVRGLGLGVSRSIMHHSNPCKRAYKEEHKLHVALKTEVDGLKSPMEDMEKIVASLSQSGTQMWSSIDHESSSKVRPPSTHQETPLYKLMHYRKNTIVAYGSLMGVSLDNLDCYKFILDEIVDGDIKLVDGVSKMEDLVPGDIIVWPTFRTFPS